MKGWKEVFSFTFNQNIKGKSAKLALFGIAALVLVIALAIPLIIGAVGEEDEEPETPEQEAYEVDTIYIQNHSGLSALSFQALAAEGGELEGIEVLEKNEETETLLKGISSEDKTIVVSIDKYRYLEEQDKSIPWEEETASETEGQLEYQFTVYTQEGFYDEEQHQESAMAAVRVLVDYFSIEKQAALELPEETRILLNTYVDYNITEMGELGEGIGEMLAKMFIPMLTTLVIYMLVLLHGQSISKIIVVEKSSKLMEMLLTSLQPYAIVFGKILGMFAVAMLQFGIWIISGIAGYLIGTKIAAEVFSSYQDPVKMLIDVLQQDAASAFSVPAVLLGIIALMLGFFMYCVLAALFAAMIKKAEDVSNGSGIYQIIVVIAFLAAYMVPLAEVSDAVVTLVRLIPITSAFMLPADVIIGNCTILTGVAGIGIMLVTTMILVYFTGKLYKKKMF